MIRYRSRKPEGAECDRLAATVGALLRTRRERAGLNQKSLAVLSGVRPGTVGAIEAGKSRPSWSTLQKLGHGLHRGDPVRAEALAHDLADAAGASLAGDPTLPPSVGREFLVEVLTRSLGRLGLEADDERVRAVVMAEIRAVAAADEAEGSPVPELASGSERGGSDVRPR